MCTPRAAIHPLTGALHLLSLLPSPSSFVISGKIKHISLSQKLSDTAKELGEVILMRTN